MGFLSSFFCKKNNIPGVTYEDLKNEMGELKKVIRKQSLVAEMHKNEIVDHLDRATMKDISHDMLRDMADSLFYLESLISESFTLSESQQESFDISWSKIEDVLKICNLRLIRESGIPFNPRFHEAVGVPPEFTGQPYVNKVVQPGYLHMDKVIRPAKVVLCQADELI